VARPDFSSVALGKSRMGIKLTGLIAYLDTVCRMPVRLIKRLLDGLYGLSVSTGEISELLHRVAKKGQAFYQSLLSELRSSSVVHADETGFREDGRNGYVWSFSNPVSRYYTYSPSRSGQVARDALGGFNQSLVSDFYGGYNWYRGLHQYCWVHLLRDLKKLFEEHPKDPRVARFIEGVRIIYEEAKAFTSESVFTRQKQRRYFQARLCALACHHQSEGTPERVLAERILKHQYGLFVFVERPEVPSDNNAAERAVRPFVVLRKVSGGTRSRQGSDTQAVLMSLFETWKLRGENPLSACQQMLGGSAQATG
jgi:transposase